MIEFERLAALVLGELEGDELDRVELHVLSCGACAGTLEQLLQLGAATRELVLSGKVRTFVAAALVARMDELGLISRRYRLAPGQVVPCAVGLDDVYALTELTANLADVERVDVLISVGGGEPVRSSDVPFEAASGLVAYVSPSDALRRLPTTRVAIELRSVHGQRESVLGQYFLDHDAGRQ